MSEPVTEPATEPVTEPATEPATEPVVDVSMNLMMIERAAPPPDILTMDDIMNDHDIVIAQERSDKALIDSIGTTHVLGLKPAFVEWYSKGCPPGYPLMMRTIVPPHQCSDGVARSLADYIEFCSGYPIQHHVGLLQAKLPDISVSFANFGGNVAVTVSKV